jgi:D-tyrosyl-tRNA(Tyr) deacylase
MKALLQRVLEARVVVDGQTVGAIQCGLLVFVCAEHGDSASVAGKLLAKILKLRIFSDGPVAGPPQAWPEPAELEPVAPSLLGQVWTGDKREASSERRPARCGAAHEVASVGADKSGKMNRSVQDVAGGLLIVSQFTLAADVSGGNRPSFTGAAPPDEGRRLYDFFVAQARAFHPVVQTGEFGADMQVHLVNDGPVTIALQV